jgi:hypothetical protein
MKDVIPVISEAVKKLDNVSPRLWVDGFRCDGKELFVDLVRYQSSPNPQELILETEEE